MRLRKRREPDLPDLGPLRQELERLGADPVARTHPRNWLWRAKRTADFIGHARPGHASFFRTINPYPKPFRHVRFETEDGVTIAAWYGPIDDAQAGHGLSDKARAAAAGDAHPEAESAPTDGRSQPGDGAHAGHGRRDRAKDAGDGGHVSAKDAGHSQHHNTTDADQDGQASPDEVDASAATQPDDGRDTRSIGTPPPFGLVIVPGMFSTKDDSVHKRRTIWLWRHWKIPVVCIDMRAFGESNGIATGAWKEAYDVHAAAKFLRDVAGVKRVGVIGESMGGASTLNAMAHDAETGTNVLTAGTLLWSAFVDMRDAVHYISAEPPEDHPFHPQWAAFRRLLRFKSHGGYERFDEYLDDAARVNGLAGFDEMADLANPKWKTSLIKAPVMLIHATDDPVVPVRHARRMERYAKEHLHIQVMVKDFGGHTGFETMEPEWYWEVTRRFFGAVNGVDLPHPLHG